MRGLELTTALDKARAMEAVTKEAHNFGEDGRNVESDNAATHFVRKVVSKQKCHRCGSANHLVARCSHKDKCCHKCHRVGHLARMCKSDPAMTRGKPRSAHALKEDSRSDDSYSEEESGQEYHCIHKLQQGCKQRSKKSQKLVTTLRVGTESIDFEVDTGAVLSTIPANIYRDKLAIGIANYDEPAFDILLAMGDFCCNFSHHWEGCAIIQGEDYRESNTSHCL